MSEQQPRSNPLALGLALAAFTVCFYAWSMFGPLGPTLQKQLHLTDFQLAFAVAIPVVLGSVMRIPMGILTERYGGQPGSKDRWADKAHEPQARTAPARRTTRADLRVGSAASLGARMARSRSRLRSAITRPTRSPRSCSPPYLGHAARTP